MNIKEEMLEELVVIAKNKGYKLITTVWKGFHFFYEFESPQGNIFKLKAKTILEKGWQKTDDDLWQELFDVAKDNKGTLISTKWLGAKVQHEFAFTDGRHFWSYPSDIKKNWPKDPDKYFNIINGRKKSSEQFIHEMKIEAQKYGGKLLSEEWNGANVSYEFEFFDGTKFEFLYSSFRVYGFPINKEDYLKKAQAQQKNQSDFLNELAELAQKNNCTLESKKWIGSNKDYQFKTQDGFLFTLQADTLKIRGWPQNLENHLYLRDRLLMSDEDRILEMKKLAKLRGGTLLEKKWLGNNIAHKFRDANNVEFYVLPGNLKKGAWSPKEGLVSEPLCRQALEYLFEKKFIKTRKVLTPEITGHPFNLELDGYSEELKIAFEYQGDPSHWDKKHDKYEKVSFRDNLKKEVCEKIGIILIEIPPFEEKNNKWCAENILNQTLSAIENKFKPLNIELPKIKENAFVPDLSKINHGIEMLQKLKERAEEKDIELLSKTWIGSKMHYNFKFPDGREFKMQANDFMRHTPKNADIYFKFSNAKLLPNDKRYECFKNLMKDLNCKILENEWLGVDKEHTIVTENNQELKIKPKDLVYLKNTDKKLNKLIKKLTIRR